MAKVRRIDWSPDEWIGGVDGVLTMRESAVYMRVLMAIYSRAGACPNDAAFIAGRFAGERKHKQSAAALTAHTQRALDRLVELGKLHISPDGAWLTNERAEVELNKARERLHGAAAAGRASGAARRNDVHPTSTQRPPNVHPTGYESNTFNDLTRTPVRIINHHYDSESSLTSISTVAARDPARIGGATGRVQAVPGTTKERVAALAAIARAKFLGAAQ